jgi:transposase-like protein
MQKLSEQAKQAIVKKALNRGEQTLRELAEANNVGLSTLGKWLKKYRNNATIKKQSAPECANSLTKEARFQHLMATASFDETAVGVYCREHGIYSFQLTQWKKEFMTDTPTEAKKGKAQEIKALRSEIKQLKQELRRKDSALSEATALLFLKKKATLIWGEDEGD